MRRDKNAPALYELIRDKPAGRSPMRPVLPSTAAPALAPKPAPMPRPVDEDDRPPSIFSPGRSIRLPIGYLIFAGLFFAVVVVASYVVGYNRRDNEERQRAARESATAMDAVDPLAVQPQNTRPSVIAPTRPQNNPTTPTDRRPQPAVQTKSPTPAPTSTPPETKSQPQTPTQNQTRQPVSPIEGASKAAPSPAPGTAPSQPQPSTKAPEKQPESAPGTRPKGVIMVSGAKDDPRTVGLNYLIAATLTPDEAEKAAQFLVGKGLEVAVVPADNRGPNRWVVILEGLAAKDLGSQKARTLEQRLQDLGRIYKNELKGPTVFNDPWWKKHTVGTSPPPDEE
jgi:hypothetical protein